MPFMCAVKVDVDPPIIHKSGWMECIGQKRGYRTKVSDVFGRRIAFYPDSY
ncbi:hypothetical protein P691DRAFT_810148, partial [Macrolepiota fuliginosa MF-IS2]